MGVGKSTSVLDQVRNNTDFPDNTIFTGLENFGNTCYANSVIQSLYSCVAFREKLQAYREEMMAQKKAGRQLSPSLLNCLADLCFQMSSANKRVHIVRPSTFINQLQKQNEFFRGPQQQDAQEFMMYLLNEINEDLIKEEKRNREKEKQRRREVPERKVDPGEGESQRRGTHSSTEEAPKEEEKQKEIITWITDIFGGVLTNETQCLRCLRTTTRNEVFLDLSVDIDDNCSIYHCLKQFSTNTHLTGNDKYMCDNCRCRQEAFKRMRIKKLPQVLVLHLKRFKYAERIQQYAKLRYSVAFPFHLKIPNTSEETEDPGRSYNLFAIVVHVGASPRFGHYVACVKYHHLWFLFDDDKIKHVNKCWVEQLFGSQGRNHTKDSYLLFYESVPSSDSSDRSRESPI